MKIHFFSKFVEDYSENIDYETHSIEEVLRDVVETLVTTNRKVSEARVLEVHQQMYEGH
jgi:hypothetical protein